MSSSQPCFGDYAGAHVSLRGPGDDRPTAIQILLDEGLLHSPNRLSDKTILITGGISGLGLEAAEALHLTGAKVFITERCSLAKGQEIAASIAEKFEAGIEQDSVYERRTLHPVQFVLMDLLDLTLVQEAAASFLTQSNNEINPLICNAGVMAPPNRMLTVQSHEMQFGVNHLGCLTLLRCSAKGFASTVVMLTSCTHRNGGLVANGDFDFEKTKYNPGVAYGQSKTANIYMANELERRFGAQVLHGLSVHPGIIMETNIVRHMTDDNKKLEAQIADAMPTFARQVKNAEQGSASTVWAAIAGKLEGMGGLYLEDCDVGQPVKEEPEWYDPGRSPWCFDKPAK